MDPLAENLVSQNGLRYTSKEGGSPFQGMGGTGQTMSCITCGKHKPRSSGAFKRFVYGRMFFCLDCKPVKG